MTEDIIRAPRFDFGAAVTQLFNLPGGKGYLFRVIGAGTLILTLCFVFLGVPIVKAYFKMFAQMAMLETMGAEPDPAQVMRMMQPIFAAMGYFTLLYLVQYAVYVSVETALYRNIIHGEDKGLFPLRFGYDEWRVFGTRIVIAVMIYAVMVAVYLAGGILLAILFALLGSMESAGAVAIIGGLIIFALSIVLFLAIIYFALRFAPASAISVRDRQFAPFASFKMMKTYVWPTLGSVLTVGVIGYLGISIFSTIAFGLLLYASGVFQFFLTLDMESEQIPDFGPLLDNLTSAGFLVPLVIVCIISIFLSLMFLGAIWSIWGYIAKLTEPRDI